MARMRRGTEAGSECAETLSATIQGLSATCKCAGNLFVYPKKRVHSRQTICNMKKGCFFFSVALCLLLAACGKPAESTVLSGNIAGLGDDTLYLYGMWDAYDHVDTIFAEDGKFSCHLDIDTITPVYLLLENRVEYPLFLDKRSEIHVTGDAARLDFLRADGNVYNMEYMVASIKARNQDAEVVILSSLRANPDSTQDAGQENYLQPLKDMVSNYEGVVVIDMTSYSEYLLSKKRSIDILANNINHPSDFLVRGFVSNIITTLYEDF